MLSRQKSPFSKKTSNFRVSLPKTLHGFEINSLESCLSHGIREMTKPSYTVFQPAEYWIKRPDPEAQLFAGPISISLPIR